MAHYGVATTKDNLSSLIDRAMAGEEVIITRHGKPTVALRAIEPPANRLGHADWIERIATLRASMPANGISGAELVRRMRDEGAH